MIILQSILDSHPDQKMWDRLLVNLQNPPLSKGVSLGDIALSNGASDAWWCARTMNWADIPLRRKVVETLITAVKRASLDVSDHRIVTGINCLDKWLSGNLVNLMQSEKMLDKISKTSFLAEAVRATLMTAYSAPEMAYVAAKAVENAIAEQHERWLPALRTEKKKQIVDIISAFPPVIFKINIDASFKI
jgi:hypothetical protein